MISDIEYVQHLDSEVAEEYQGAAEFIAVKPDYSCLCLRRAGELLCTKLAAQSDIDFDSRKFDKRINMLFKHAIIDENTKNSFHKMRIICNAWLHKNTDVSRCEQNDCSSNVKRRHIEEARKARMFFLNVINGVFNKFSKFDKIPEYELLDVDGQINKEIMYAACTSSSSHAKLKAGLVYESMGDDQGNIDFSEDSPNSYAKRGVLCPDHEYRHYTYLYELAAESYDSACWISALIGQEGRHYPSSLLKERGEDWIASSCDLEPLFRYGALTCDGRLGDVKKDLGIARLRVAARRGHVEAAACCGGALYNEGEYKESYDFLLQAAEYDDVYALRMMYYYFQEGKACQLDICKAVSYIQRAIDLGCPDALAVWGLAHFKGVVVKKDAAKGNKILEDAKTIGSSIALQHFALKEITKGVQKKCKKFAKHLSDTGRHVDMSSGSSKVGRNELCPCGSGKKYKKCCGKNSF